MATILVAYATTEGQTARVAERVAETLAAAGHAPATVNLAEAADDVDVAEYDAAVVGASVHVGKHQSVVREFAAERRDALSAMPTAFFQVSLSSATEEGREQAAGYVEAFVADTGWEPDRIGTFGGALRYSEMGFLKRAFIRRVARTAVPGTDTSEDAEFTDWDEVAAFATDFGGVVADRLGGESA